ncbi:MAG TPA: sugar hydrolase [Bacteroidales bacterium]|nr:sugar hydrolase [Bacteroidales bacterium]
MKTCLLSLIITVFVLFSGCGTKDQDKEIKSDSSIKDNPCNYINPFIGTGGDGHTYPGATVPFGMVQVSPDTRIDHFSKSYKWCAGYQYGDSTVNGFSHTHFSGTGHSDMGDVLIMPVCGKFNLQPGNEKDPNPGYKSKFSHENESAKPGYYSVFLDDYGIKAELSATTRAGIHRYTFTKKDSSYVLLDLKSSIYNYSGKVLFSQIRIENDSTVTGYRQTKGWGENRFVFFSMKFSKPIKSYEIKRDKQFEYMGFGNRSNRLKNYPVMSGQDLMAWFNFDLKENEQLLVKVGISAVDIEGAKRNLDKEIPDFDFEKVKKDAWEQWTVEMQKIIIEGSDEQKQNFYTAMYHTMLAPTVYMDVDGRYRGIDNGIHKARGFVNYTLYSLWDTYRAEHPLFTIINKERVGDMIASMLKHREQSVHKILPVWAFHGNETWCMIGYHGVSVIADAYLKGIRNYDVDEAYEAVLASANYGEYGGLKHYIKFGYMPADLENESVSKTLEYAYDDWCIAQMAKSMDKKEYHTFLQRAVSYKNIFDPVTKFMRPKNSDLKWKETFDPMFAQYGSDYTEGNAWQYSWYVPHDVAGLIDMMGGNEAFIEKLDSLFTLKGDEDQFKHVEDIAGLIGQYAHGNEPSHHIAYLYNYAGAPWKTQEKIHEIMKGLFSNTPYGLSGNDDCGQMSSWYIFSSMGFYPVCPGSLEYIIGSPCIPKATITVDEGKTFVMEAKNLSKDNIYIQSANLNGKQLNRTFITHDEIMKGGNLVFEMGAEPNKKWGMGGDLPYSVSN